jgi:hypothetical protein
MTDPRAGAPGETPEDAQPTDETIADEATDEANATEVAEPVPVVAGDPVEADPDLATDRAPERAAPPPRERDREREARARAARMAAPVPSPSDQAVHIDDRISKLYVIATVVVFLLIFLNGLLLGRGGALSPAPTPTPVPSATVAPSASPSGSASPGASSSASPGASSSASPVASASPSPS